MAAKRREAKLKGLAGVTTQELAALPTDAFSIEAVLEKPTAIPSKEANDVKSTAVDACGDATFLSGGGRKVPPRREKSNPTQLEPTHIEMVPVKGEHKGLPVTLQECQIVPVVKAQQGRNHASPWVRKFDANTQRFYYANRQSRQTVWQEPSEGWRDVRRDQRVKPRTVSASEADNAAGSSRGSSSWVRKRDPNTQRFYYANIYTRQAVWREPAEGWHEAAAKPKATLPSH